MVVVCRILSGCRFYSTKLSPCSSISMYNLASKSLTPLKSSKSKYLSWYSCGPTVYDTAHIGHASCYVRLDIIRRIISKWFGFHPIIAMGITDVDDKIIARANVLNVDFKIVAKKYETKFFRDMRQLNVLQPHFVVRVSEHIDDIIQFINQLLLKEHAYILDGSVYFNTQSLQNYGKITRPQLKDSQSTKQEGRIHPADFALWKAAKAGEPFWSSPWSNGRPGWHIECSAMASKIFGNKIDVHTGGLDLAFPHHENEEAQSCAFHSVQQWVDLWVHTGHMLMNGMKMSKSMKNFIPISTYLESNTSDHFRMLCLMTHYRTSIDFTPVVLQKAVRMVDKFSTFLSDARGYQKGDWDRGNISPAVLLESVEKTHEAILQNLSKDVNTAQCINAIEDLVKTATIMLHLDSNGSAREPVAVALCADFVEDFLLSLGFFQKKQEEAATDNTDLIMQKLVGFRSHIREMALSKKKNDDSWKEVLNCCDTLRDDLSTVGVTIKDTSKSTSTWSKQ